MSTLSEKEKQNYLNQLFEFLELPSISADSRYKETMEETAKWLSNPVSYTHLTLPTICSV